MGWAVTYSVKFGRKLTAEEERVFAAWTKENLALTPVGSNAVIVPDKEGIRRRPIPKDNSWLDEWRGLLPAQEIGRLESFANAERARAKALTEESPHGDADADHAGFIQTRSNAAFCRVVRAFQKLEQLLPFAEISISDDHYLRSIRPGAAGDPWKLVKG